MTRSNSNPTQTTHSMTSMERVACTMKHAEPDRVPLFLSITLHGAKELGLSIQDYFSKAKNVVEAQLRLLKKYNSDSILGLFYGSLEIEAFGGESIFIDDGPPNAGEPIISKSSQIKTLTPPIVADCPGLMKVLDTIKQLKEKTKNQVPIYGLAISPLTLPIMQLGFGKYLNLAHEQPKLFWQLIRINESFCTAWANAQLAAGATGIVYYDPASSPSITAERLYAKIGYPVAKRVLSKINGPTATHFASGRCLPILDQVITTGTLGVGVSKDEPLHRLKSKCKNKITVIGNLNGLEMRHWTAAQTEREVKAAIAQAGPGGGFILSDNHGEIPWQVSDEIISTVSSAVHKWGQYPLDWTNNHAW